MVFARDTDALRHAGQLSHVDTEGVLASTPFQPYARKMTFCSTSRTDTL